jgi:hypothetical protein
MLGTSNFAQPGTLHKVAAATVAALADVYILEMFE